ncbi:MAG: tetratricopeptide repeat protein [Planctomycetota bacterium]|jgi:tetratricopeptide (TPR) repeat protein
MKIKTKNLKQAKSSEFYAMVLQLLLCIFCIPGTAGAAESPSERLDPTNLLVDHSIQILPDANISNVPVHSGQYPPARQLQLQACPNSIGTAAINFAAQVNTEFPQNTFITTTTPNSNLKQELRQAKISFPIDEEDKQNKDELKWIIEQIRSIEFKQREKTREPAIIIEPTPSSSDTAGETKESLSSALDANEKIQTTSDTAPLEKTEEKAMQPKLPYEPVSEQTLQMLESTSQYPEQLNNPFELAEVLFLSGQLKEAATFYQEALKRISADEASPAKDRAWILLQIGNCLRNEDRQAAKQMYRQLISEYPDSPWTDFAKSQEKLLDWYLKDNPRTLISDAISQ